MADSIQERILEEVADLHGVPAGAYNIRANGQTAGRNTTANTVSYTHLDVYKRQVWSLARKVMEYATDLWPASTWAPSYTSKSL